MQVCIYKSVHDPVRRISCLTLLNRRSLPHATDTFTIRAPDMNQNRISRLSPFLVLFPGSGYVCNLLYPQEACKAVLYSSTFLLRLQQVVTPLAN